MAFSFYFFPFSYYWRFLSVCILHDDHILINELFGYTQSNYFMTRIYSLVLCKSLCYSEINSYIVFYWKNELFCRSISNVSKISKPIIMILLTIYKKMSFSKYVVLFSFQDFSNKFKIYKRKSLSTITLEKISKHKLHNQ